MGVTPPMMKNPVQSPWTRVKKKKRQKLGVVVHSFNPSIREVETGQRVMTSQLAESASWCTNACAHTCMCTHMHMRKCSAYKNLEEDIRSFGAGVADCWELPDVGSGSWR